MLRELIAVHDELRVGAGAKFVQIEVQQESEGGGSGQYAKELSEEAHRKEVELLAKAVKENDIIITTAAIPGRPAPEMAPVPRFFRTW